MGKAFDDLRNELPGIGLMEQFKNTMAAVRKDALANDVPEDTITFAEMIGECNFFAGARAVVRGLAKVHMECDGDPVVFEDRATTLLAGVELEIHDYKETVVREALAIARESAAAN